MQYYINEWSDQTASLITEDGYTLDTFINLDDAIDACVSDRMVYPEYIESNDNYPDVSAIDFETCFFDY